MTELPVMTEAQEAVLDFMIRGLIADQRIPTVEEIKNHFNYGSANAVSCHIRNLLRKGYLERRKNGRGGRSPYKIAGAVLSIEFPMGRGVRRATN